MAAEAPSRAAEWYAHSTLADLYAVAKSMIWGTTLRPLLTVLPIVTLGLGVGLAQTPAQLEIFEKNARPVFAEKCQGCHNAKLKSGGIDFSSPGSIKEAASMGIFGSPAEPEKSVIMQALSYESHIKMPPQGKLPAETESLTVSTATRIASAGLAFRHCRIFFAVAHAFVHQAFTYECAR